MWKFQTYLILQLGVLLLGVDEVEQDVERAGEDEGQEQAEAREVGIPLRATRQSRSANGAPERARVTH